MWPAGSSLARRVHSSNGLKQRLRAFANPLIDVESWEERIPRAGDERVSQSGTPECSLLGVAASRFAERLQESCGRRNQRTAGRDMAARRVSTTAGHSSPSAAHLWEASDMPSYEERLARHELTHKALLVDAAGTLLIPTQPAAKMYRELGLKYGVTYSENEILARYRRAYSQPWYHSRLRYVDDGRPFWKFVVSEATGCADEEYFNELYDYYSTADAWQLLDPESEKVFASIRRAGIKLAVVSNFDTRLRPIMRQLDCDHWFDVLAVSAEVEYEKPNPTIFLHACEQLGVEPRDAVHVGDDRRNDVWGARDAGCDAWLWGYDVHTFREVAEQIGVDVDAPRL